MFIFFKKIGLSIFLMSIVFTISAHSDTTQFKIQQVTINGESNVMNFWLKFSETVSSEVKYTHIHSQNNKKAIRIFNLPIISFEGQNKQIESDFRKMLKAEQFPHIAISIDENLCLSQQNGLVKELFIHITIGGKERDIPIECIWKENVVNGRQFKGKGIIHLSDFDLVSPKRLFGLVRVKETILITFEVQVSTIKRIE